MNNKNLFLISVVAHCLLFNSLIFTEPAQIIAKESNMYQLVAKENLKTMAALDHAEGYADDNSNTLVDVINDEKEFYEVVEETLKQQLHPKKSSKRQMVFSLLSQHKDAPQISEYTVLDEKSWQDLELLSGPKSNLNYYVASCVDRASTEMGRAILYQKIISPTTDYDTLIARQNIVKLLVEREDLFDELNTPLAFLGISENAMLSFWLESDLFRSKQQEMMIKLPFQSKIPLLKKIAAVCNTSEFMLEWRGRLTQCTEIAIGLMHTAGACALPAYLLTQCFGHLIADEYVQSVKNGFDQVGSSGLAIFSATGLLFYLLDLKNQNENSYIRNGKNTAAGMTSTYFASRFPVHFKTGLIIEKCMQEKLIQVARYWNSVQKIIKRVQADEELSRALPQIRNLDFSKKSKEIRHMLSLLSTSTFKGKASIFSSMGRIISAYRLLTQHKQELIDVMVALGELDAYMSIARLYKEYEDKRVCFCFPTYIKPTDAVGGPSIAIKNFWNPMLKIKRAVPNSIKIGTDKDHARNIIITGPNAGGKSTIMKALVLNIIFAQSFGIAPSESLTFTPYAKIITYLNITDDIAAGNSLFKAGALRARELITTINNLKDGEYALTAVDEVFNGTTYKEGQAAAYTFIKLLGANKKTICLTPTHFHLVSNLEKETAFFANYKVSVIEKPGQNITYPYILERGISDQIITFKILQEEGFGDEFLAEAQAIVNGQD